MARRFDGGLVVYFCGYDHNSKVVSAGGSAPKIPAAERDRDYGVAY